MWRRARIGCLVMVALLIAAAVGFVVWADKSITLRYRFTLVVDDNGHAVRGSAVYETQWAGVGEYFPSLAILGGGRRWLPVYSGEATYVDLGTPGIVFALMTYDPLREGSALYPPSLLVAAFGYSLIGAVTWDLLYRIRDTRGPIDVPTERLPLLVRFLNLNDPATAERVDPFDLAASFGVGIKLQRATIEITNDPVTTGIDQKLPWLALPQADQDKLFKGLQWGGPGADNNHDRRLFPRYFKAVEEDK
jgi:hypothetical protein